MKTSLITLAAALLLTTGAFASEMQNNEVNAKSFADIDFRNDQSTEHSTWVTIYNTVGRISDARCVKAGDSTTFGGYYPVPMLNYEIRTEVKENKDCGGRTINDQSKSFGMGGSGVSVELSKSDEGRYELNIQ